MFESEVAALRARSHSRRDRIGAPALPEQVKALADAVAAEFGIRLPAAYAEFLRECNGFRINESRLLAIDAEVWPTNETLGPLETCVSFNRDRRDANAAAGITDRFLYLAWIDDSTFCMKPDGTFWEQDPETTDDVEQFRTGADLIRYIVARVVQT